MTINQLNQQRKAKIQAKAQVANTVMKNMNKTCSMANNKAMAILPSNANIELLIPHANDPTKEQQNVIDQICDFYKSTFSNEMHIKIAGFAGTGKSFIIPFIIQQLNFKLNNVICAAYTGKAALVMKNNGIQTAQTLHSALYEQRMHTIDKTDKRYPHFKATAIMTADHKNSSSFINFEKRTYFPKHIKLLIVDEASIIPKYMHDDLLSFNVKIVYIGDGYQLPPVSADNFNLMQDPHLALSKIHRQAANNPIIKMSINIRENTVNPNFYKGKYNQINIVAPDNVNNNIFTEQNSQILCGKNITRLSLNNYVRHLNKMNSFTFPQKGEKIIVLKNDYKYNLVNGQILLLQNNPIPSQVLKKALHIKARDYADINNVFAMIDKENIEIPIYKEFYETQADFFNSTDTYAKAPTYDSKTMNDNKAIHSDFAYAVTVHKAQGSSFKHTILYDDHITSNMYNFRNRWLYTAVTRTEDKLTWITEY